MYAKDEFQELIQGKQAQVRSSNPDKSNTSIIFSILYPIPLSFLPGNPKQYTVFQVNGQSMEPVIQHQDIVVIKNDQSGEKADGKIADARTDDGLTIKKVQIEHHRQKTIFQPFNIDYPVLVLDSDWNYGAFLIGTIALQLRFF